MFGAAALILCMTTADLPATQNLEMVTSTLGSLAGGSALYVTGAGTERPLAAASGAADPSNGRAMSVETPLRIASITKTFVAAAVLRLAERNLIELDAAIGPLVDPGLAEVLRADGYDLDRMTVRQLLSHSAGLYDHAGDPRYIAAVLAAPEHRWTRGGLMELLTAYGDPLAAPGSEFHYSDSGYVLLGDIVERTTGRALAQVIREELAFDRLGLTSTWWEVAEPAPANAVARARQFIDGRDTTDIHASFDLYGGGGLVMSARDLATWFAALFEGRIFERSETLAVMTSRGDHQGAELYRLGLVVETTAEGEIYGHSGFWGTVVFYDPRLRRVVVGYTTQREEYRSGILPLVKATIGASSLNCKTTPGG